MIRKNKCFSRSSHPEGFCKKGVLKNFEKFTGKHLCQSLFFNEVTSLRPVTLLKKRCFPVNLVKFLRTPIFVEHLWWLLLLFRNRIFTKALWKHHPTILRANSILQVKRWRYRHKNILSCHKCLHNVFLSFFVIQKQTCWVVFERGSNLVN